MPRKNVLTEIASEAKKKHVRKLMKSMRLNRSEAAKHLGISRQAVQQLLGK